MPKASQAIKMERGEVPTITPLHHYIITLLTVSVSAQQAIKTLMLLVFVALATILQVSLVHAQNASGITSPAGGVPISGDVIIQGTAVIEPFQKYELAYKKEPSASDAFSYFDGGTSPVVNAALGIWRTNGFEPGVYTLRLRVVKLDGNYDEFFAANILVGQVIAAEPTPTETPAESPTSSEPTPTPIPSSTFTPGPTNTPAIGEVIQPQISEDPLQPTPTPQSVAVVVDANPSASGDSSGVIVNPENSTTGEQSAGLLPSQSSSGSVGAIGQALSLERLRDEFWRGVRYSAAFCIIGLALVASRQIYDWSRRRFR